MLIYDLEINKAYVLNETSAIVFNACDGKITFANLNEKYNLTDDLIFFALEQFHKTNLLKKDSHFTSPFIGMSRREVIKKVGLSTMIALPMISSVIAPSAAMAQSVSCINNGAISNGTTPNTGNLSSNFANCANNAVSYCCNNGTDGSPIDFDDSTNPVTCSVTCGNIDLGF